MTERIVPAINHHAAALRDARGGVFRGRDAQHQPRKTDSMVMQRISTPAAPATRNAAMIQGAPGHASWPALDVREADETVLKRRFSAFMQGSSHLPQRPCARGLDTVRVGGTATSPCCENSARDAMMPDLRTIIVAECNAANSDAAHNASLASSWNNFGDVMTTDHVIDRLRGGAFGKAAA
ncbi:isochorismatase family protein [Roseomonas sp. CAU 1739]|uniref:isochorismatase family protein n=1 Tax=Roseomonas sp. CAU 1739 TaxID=3140364 RepID=UPI00325A64D9